MNKYVGYVLLKFLLGILEKNEQVCRVRTLREIIQEIIQTSNILIYTQLGNLLIFSNFKSSSFPITYDSKSLN